MIKIPDRELVKHNTLHLSDIREKQETRIISFNISYIYLNLLYPCFKFIKIDLIFSSGPPVHPFDYNGFVASVVFFNTTIPVKTTEVPVTIAPQPTFPENSGNNAIKS